MITLFIEGCNRPKSSLMHSCIFPGAKYVNVVNVEIMSISGAMAFLRMSAMLFILLTILDLNNSFKG